MRTQMETKKILRGNIVLHVLILSVFFLAVSAEFVWSQSLSPEQASAYRRAAAYSRSHRGLSMVVLKDGQLVFENYAAGVTADEAHNLFSGTKSFSCAIAVAASEDRLLNLDELVAKTITEWQDDPRKSKITIRQLLTLTSGIDAGETGSIPSYAKSLQSRALHEPGTAFAYGPAPFQVFGELMRRKLRGKYEGPRQYLQQRILNPIGIEIKKWRTGSDGHAKMSAGVFLSARDWAKYGQLILNKGKWKGRQILNKDLLRQCFRGTKVNPGYGITFWLPTQGGVDSKGHNSSKSAAALKAIHAPELIIKAAGAGGQKMYIIPSKNLVIVRQSSRVPLWGWGFKDAEFLAPFFKQS